MSGILDGISSVSSITVQIDALKDQAATDSASSSSISSDPNENLLSLQQSFDKILNSFLSTKKNDNNYLSNLYSVDAQINALKNSDPKLALLNIQQSLNDILGNLFTSKDEEEEEEEANPFSAWTTYQTSIANLSNPPSQSNSSTTFNLYQYLAAQYSLNLDAAF